MHHPIEILSGVYYVGVNDRRTALFENLWPIPRGVSYNAYLLRDDQNVLVDTAEAGRSGFFLENLRAALGGEPLDYVVIDHVEPDHSGSLREVLSAWPEAVVVGNKKTRDLIGRFYGFDGAFHEVGDGDTLCTGKKTLSFVLTPMVHWPESMMAYETSAGVLFSSDAFGSFGTLDGALCDDETDPGGYEGEMRRYYANIVGKYSPMVQKALGRLAGVPVSAVCPSHGLIWRKDPGRVVSLYDRWSRQEADPGVVIAFGSMYGHTESLADDLARLLVEEGVSRVRVFDASRTHPSYILSEIWRTRGLLLGSCAYNAGMLPTVEQLTAKLEQSGLADRLLGFFGNYSWSGGGVRTLEAFGERTGWEVVAPPIEARSATVLSDRDRLAGLAGAMARRLRTDR